MPQTILLIENDTAVRRAHTEIIREAGFEVIEAAAGPEALKLASEKQPALVVAAVELPGIDGFDLAKRLRADLRTASIPVLHTSSRRDDYPESLKSGAEAYLQSPVEGPLLIAVVTALIQRARTASAEDRFKALIDSIPDEVWFTDAQGRFTQANRSALREFKMAAPAQVDVKEFAGSLEVYRADGSPRPVEEAPPLRALKGETVRSQEEIVRTPGHGELRHRQVSASPVRDAAGAIVGAVSLVRDITERRRAEQALRASEERYRTLFETMTEGFALDEIVCDEAGKPCDLRYLTVNLAFERQTGLKAADILGRTVMELFPGTEPIWIERYGKVALTGEPARFEEWFGPLGRWFEVSAFQTEPGRFGVVFADITERRRAEEERQRLAGNLAAILDAAPVAIWIAHDPRCLRITGNAYADQVVMQTERGGNISASALPGDVAVSYRAFRNGVELRPEELPAQIAAATGQPVKQEELDLVFPDGRTVHLLLGAVPLFDAEGRVRGAVAAGVDVSRRKRAEEALRESEAVLRSFFDSPGMMRGFVELIDGGVVHVSCNQAAAVLFGVDRESIAGKTATEAGTAEEVARLWVDLYDKSRRTGQPVSMEYARRGADGRERWLLATASYVGTGPSEHPRFAYTILDFTERKRAEEALRESEDRFRAQLTASSDVVYRMSPDWSEMRQLRGRDFIPDTEAPNRAWLLKYIPPDDRAHVMAVIDQAIRTKSVFELEHRVLRVDGTLGWTFSRAIPLQDAKGEIVEWWGAASDITERKRAEEALRESESRLRALSDNLPEGAIYRYRHDVHGEPHVDFISAGIERLIGVPAAEYMADAATVERNIVPEDRDRMKAGIAASRERLTQFEMEVRHRHRVTGEVRWSLLRSTPVRLSDGSTVWDGIELDITKRKRAEEALRESEKRYRAIGESIDYGVWVCAPDGRNTYASESFLKLVGMTQEQCSSFGWGDVLHPDDAERTLAAWKECVRTEGIWDIEHRFLGVDGEWHPVLARGVPVRDEQGRVTCWVGINLDIAERKRAEENMLDSEARYRRLFDTLIEGFCIIEVIFDGDVPVDYRFLEINPAFEKRTGLKNARGRLMRELAPDHEAHWFEIYGHVALTGQPARFVNEARALNRWYDVSAYRIGGSESRKVAILFNDITEAKRATDALRESESRERARAAEVEAIMDAAPAAIFIAHDAECRSMSGNRTAHTLLQREPGKNLSKSASEGERPANFRAMKDGIEIPPQELPVQKAAATGQPVRNYELDVVFEDGATLNLLADAVPMLDEDGRPRGAVGILSDITELKRAERRLRESQKLESLGLLAGGVAHDFNNLLVGVIGNASLAQDILPPDHPVAELLTAVLKTGEQAAHLTRQMLAYSGKGKFLVEALDLSALIPDMSGQVQQVFMNLVLNAAEAIGSHEGLITVKTGVESVNARYIRQHPEAAGLQPGKYVSLEVSDNGGGMDEATRARIFDPFFTTKFTGRGLGLAAVAGIVRGHKGAIVTGSAPGKGSCFTVLFPAAARVAEEPAVAAPEATLHGAGVVLVVDDERVVLEMARRALERQGYAVLLADSGRAAIGLLKTHPGDINLVVLDLSMPNMNGEEALPELRKLRPAVKVVVSSGYSEAETMILFKGQRVSGFIQKPYTAAGLAEKVKACLG